jgi:hypothetical protein
MWRVEFIDRSFGIYTSKQLNSLVEFGKFEEILKVERV